MTRLIIEYNDLGDGRVQIVTKKGKSLYQTEAEMHLAMQTAELVGLIAGMSGDMGVNLQTIMEVEREDHAAGVSGKRSKPDRRASFFTWLRHVTGGNGNRKDPHEPPRAGEGRPL